MSLSPTERAFLCWLLLVCLASPALAQVPTDTPSHCSAERGEPAPGHETDTIRYAVILLETGWQAQGYLYFSRDRIRFEPYQPASYQGRPLDAPRANLQQAQEWTVFGVHTGAAELKFRDAGKWHFMQMLCSVYAAGGMPRSGDPRNYQDILAAANQFATELGRVRALAEARQQQGAKARQEQQEKTVREEEARVARETESRKARVATLRVTAQPGGAQVYVDDKFKGSTSEKEGVLVIEDLPPGTYRLRLSFLGHKDWTGQATMAGGETRTVEAMLAAAGPKPLAADEIEEALKNGVAKSRIMGFIRDYGVDFALTGDIEQRLRDVGADSDLLLAITKARK